MRRCFANLTRVILCALPLVVLVQDASRIAAAQNHPLDAPLLSANMCGTGQAGDLHFTFAATGDTFPHENIQAVGEREGYDYLFDHVRPFLQAADIAYTNFDGAMLAGSPYTGYPAFNYNPQLATALHNAGIDVVSTANNHILDRGPEGLDATLEVLHEAGIVQHGAVPRYASGQPRPSYLPVTLTRNGITITVGFLSFTWGTNGIPDPHNQVNLLWQSNDYGQQGGIRQSVLDAIAQARQETDFVIVAAHWGYEYQFYPDPAQEEGAARMAAAGADVILGAQPHTLQPVDIIDTGGRKTLVIYSLANFIASQAAFQDSFFSNTSVIFYVGIVRHPDGTVRLSGYRYLPMTMVDYDTRPAPIAAYGYDYLYAHVRQKMRDPHGLRQVAPDPAAVGDWLPVCPEYTFEAAPVYPVAGDFAQHIATLGSGVVPRPLHEAIAVFGYPLGPVVQELSGDCQHTTSVLYTERQRLEWQPGKDWPARVVGTQIGTEVYKYRYGVDKVERRLDLAGDAIINEPFRMFYNTRGGLYVFGYPISGELVETDPVSGQQKTVQYFERARLELLPNRQVQTGLLSREYPGIAAQCGLLPPEQPAPGMPLPPVPPSVPAPPPAAVETGEVLTPWDWSFIVLTVLLLLAVGVYATQELWQRRHPRRPVGPVFDADEQLLRDLLYNPPDAEGTTEGRNRKS